MKHKYAEILMAIANGDIIQVRHPEGWGDIMEHAVVSAILNDLKGSQYYALQPEDFRVKPKTIMIGKHEVEAPISVAPSRGTTYFYRISKCFRLPLRY